MSGMMCWSQHFPWNRAQTHLEQERDLVVLDRYAGAHESPHQCGPRVNSAPVQADVDNGHGVLEGGGGILARQGGQQDEGGDG
jgi:hypothetical protein